MAGIAGLTALKTFLGVDKVGPVLAEKLHSVKSYLDVLKIAKREFEALGNTSYNFLKVRLVMPPRMGGAGLSEFSNERLNEIILQFHQSLIAALEKDQPIPPEPMEDLFKYASSTLAANQTSEQSNN